jgi:hypothetical protein
LPCLEVLTAGVAARCSVRKPGPAMTPAHVRHTATSVASQADMKPGKEQTLAHWTALNEPDAPLSCLECHRPCSMARQRTVVPRSGRRGRRFKSCHPDQCHRSPTCANAVPCARYPPPRNRERGLEGTERNTREPPRESRGGLRRAEEHPASPHDVAHPAAQQGPSVHCVPPSATKMPSGSGRPPAGNQCRSEVGKLVRLGTISERTPRRIQSTPAPSTRPNECVQMARGEPLGPQGIALYGTVIGNAASYALRTRSVSSSLFGDDRYCVDLHERARASVSCGGNDRDGCAVIAPH